MIIKAHDDARKAESERWMLARMKHEQFTFGNLYGRYGNEAPEYREADRLIQKERRAGNIKQVKRGVWEWIGPR